MSQNDELSRICNEMKSWISIRPARLAEDREGSDPCSSQTMDQPPSPAVLESPSKIQLPQQSDIDVVAAPVTVSEPPPCSINYRDNDSSFEKASASANENVSADHCVSANESVFGDNNVLANKSVLEDKSVSEFAKKKVSATKSNPTDGDVSENESVPAKRSGSATKSVPSEEGASGYKSVPEKRIGSVTKSDPTDEGATLNESVPAKETVSPDRSATANKGDTANERISTNGRVCAQKSQQSVSATPEIPLPAPLHVIEAVFGSNVKVRSLSFSEVCSWSVSSIRSCSPTDEAFYDPSVSKECDEQKQTGAKRFEHSPDDRPPETPEPCNVLIPHAQLGDIALAHCEIDPEKGEFLLPHPQPDTLQSLASGPRRGFHDIAWRQANMTSEWQILKEQNRLERLAALKREHPLQTVEKAGEKESQNAKCNIRPAVESDFVQIANIFNACKKGRGRVLGADIMTPEAVATIFEACQSDKRPFIVATPSTVDLLDRSKWPKDSEEVYEQFSRYLMDHPNPVAAVVGFAFVTDFRSNEAYGIDFPWSNFLGRLQLVIHPDHAGKMYASALMDRIMRSISPYHQGLIDHGWHCDDTNGIYEESATRNLRQYTHLYAESVEPRQADDGKASSWESDLFERFDFAEIAKFRNTLMTLDEQLHSCWSHLAVWECCITPVTNICPGP
ncbi:Acyl-CoA N-acyltransferase [Moelleriella libera RCEF 2490]|uniref:Acyl-CoA N-acyltransferase n=1 Tax=Moelleriella libera RCEF 2490 TaxID=1081109 RepID=A0A167W8B0_9HYPO|nr:Acyl-CoA N-acyltransferase [Moelleriella libera RCEF 2490]